jgi:hypothetical protein
MRAIRRVPERVSRRVPETLFPPTTTQPHLATQPQRTSTQHTGTNTSGPAGGPTNPRHSSDAYVTVTSLRRRASAMTTTTESDERETA